MIYVTRISIKCNRRSLELFISEVVLNALNFIIYFILKIDRETYLFLCDLMGSKIFEIYTRLTDTLKTLDNSWIKIPTPYVKFFARFIVPCREFCFRSTASNLPFFFVMFVDFHFVDYHLPFNMYI